MAHCVQKLLTGPLIKLVRNRQMSYLTTCAASRYISCSDTFNSYNNLKGFEASAGNHVCGEMRNVFYQPVRYAGHSHWHNIRHIKVAMDKIRAKHNIRITQKIRTALKGMLLSSADQQLFVDI